MIRVVLDTNILVSALLSPKGTPAKVFDHFLNSDFLLCFDSTIIAEYRAVLKRPKFGFDQIAVEQILEYIEKTGLAVIPKPLDIDAVDQDDKIFYEVAVHTGGYLVTGNARHFPEKETVVSAVEFLAILEKQLSRGS